MTEDLHAAFRNECQQRVTSYADSSLAAAAKDFMRESTIPKYSYNFTWLGRPIIQYPQDIVAMQELVWRIQPDLIIETGVAHGGSLILYSSLLELNAICGGPGDAMVLGIDIDIRQHNRDAIEAHPMFRRITMIEGSSIAAPIIAKVREYAAQKARVLVCLDSNHTHGHVLAELKAYAPLVAPGSYCVVFDTIIEDLPPDTYPDRPWGPGNSPKSAVDEFLGLHTEFINDSAIDSKLLISVAQRGFLKRLR